MENTDMFNAATNFHDFLQRMKDPSAADLVRSIKSFIVNFMSSPLDPALDSASVQEFLSSTEIAFKAHPLWANATEEELENAAEGLEKYVVTKLFSRAYSPLPADAMKDQELSDKISLLQHFLKPEHLDLPRSFQEESSWLIAVKELQRINSYKAPRDKLVCILNCCRVINNLLLTAKTGTPPGAEDFLPALIYIVIKANPPQLHSNLQFIERYRHNSRLVAEASYFYTSMVSVESFIEKLDGKSLSMDESEFDSRMESARAALFGSGRPKTPEKSALPKENAKLEGKRSPSQTARSSSPASTHDNVLSVAKLEATGASGIVEADRSGQLAKEYPFLYASAGDLKVEDVETLLTHYKEVVLKYVALSKGLESVGRKAKVEQAQNAASSAPENLVTDTGAQRTETEDSVQGVQGLQETSTNEEGNNLYVSGVSEELTWEKPHEEEQWENVTQVVSNESHDAEPVVVPTGENL